MDTEGILSGIKIDDGSGKSWRQRQVEKGHETSDAYLQTIEELMSDGTTAIDYKDIADAMGKDAETVRRDLGEAKRKHKGRIEKAGYRYVKGVIIKNGGQADGQ